MRAREASRHDHRILRRHQHSGEFGHRGDPRLVASANVSFGIAKSVRPAIGISDNSASATRTTGADRSGHRDLVRPDGGLRELWKRYRRIVKLREVPNQRWRILNAMHPVNVGPPRGRVQIVAEHHEDRDAVTESVIDRHRRMLQAHGAVGKHQHRLAFHFEVPVPHCDRRFFVAAGKEFRLRISAVIDDRFLNAPERGSRIGAHVFKPKGLEDVDHEVSARSVCSDRFRLRPRRSRLLLSLWLSRTQSGRK